MVFAKYLPLRHITKIPARLGRAENDTVRGAYIAARSVARRVVNGLTPLQLGWDGALRDAGWSADSVFEITGWAYERGSDFAAAEPRIRVRLRALGQPDVEAEVTRFDEPLVNAGLKDENFSYSAAAFVARFDVADLIRVAGSRSRTWRIVVTVTTGNHSVSGRFSRRTRLGSGNHLFARTFDGVQVLPVWTERHGLSLRVGHPAALAVCCGVDGRLVTADLRLSGTRFARAELVSVQGVVPLTSQPIAAGGLRVTGLLPPVDLDGQGSPIDLEYEEERFSPEVGEPALPMLSWRMVVVDDKSRRHEVATVLDPAVPVEAPTALPFSYPGPDGSLRLLDAVAILVVTETTATGGSDPSAHLRGTVLGGPVEDLSLTLVGARARRPMTVSMGPDDDFRADGSWLSGSWGGPRTPPPPGRYFVRGQDADGRWLPAIAAIGVGGEAVATPDLDGFACLTGVASGRRPIFSVARPLKPNELGAFGQARLARRYQKPSNRIAEQFYFEGFGGSAATCNPLGLDREVARRLPDMPRYWGVNDASVTVPAGAIPVVRGTEDWWRARQSSRFVITNEWLKRGYQHLPGQTVLQTWHGSMLKRIGLDRTTSDLVTRSALLTEVSKWDLLLSQNPHSTDIFRSAYRWDKEIWEEGYPRNDALFTGDRAAIREKLGIPDGKIAVLYAPTWRENVTEMVTFLDLERLSAELGDQYLLLLRGHSRTMSFGSDVYLPGVLDVTSYPDINDLFLAADAMITDYSSVMFDFSVTGRPMIFFVPDMDDYRDSLRGVYFDLSEVAPGPVLERQDQVAEAIRSLESSAPLYAQRYREWRDRFNPHDDGHASERVINRLLALR